MLFAGAATSTSFWNLTMTDASIVSASKREMSLGMGSLHRELPTRIRGLGQSVKSGEPSGSRLAVRFRTDRLATLPDLRIPSPFNLWRDGA